MTQKRTTHKNRWEPAGEKLRELVDSGTLSDDELFDIAIKYSLARYPNVNRILAQDD